MEILYQDEQLVAVDKPAGLAVHRGQGDREVAMTLLRDQLNRWVYPVHRIDRPTSGVLLFALSSEAAAPVALAFAEGRAHKLYLLLCRGVPEAEGSVDYPLQRSEGGERVPAVTDYWRLWSNERYALVLARPRTGRPHQIRRHLKHITHPLIGDVRFGRGDHNRLFREQHGLFRLALHALELIVPHPLTGARLVLRAPLPPDLSGPLGSLGVPPELLAGVFERVEAVASRGEASDGSGP